MKTGLTIAVGQFRTQSSRAVISPCLGGPVLLWADVQSCRAQFHSRAKSSASPRWDPYRMGGELPRTLSPSWPCH